MINNTVLLHYRNILNFSAKLCYNFAIKLLSILLNVTFFLWDFNYKYFTEVCGNKERTHLMKLLTFIYP